MSKEWNIRLQVTSDCFIPYTVEADNEVEAHQKAKTLLRKLAEEKSTDMLGITVDIVNQVSQPGTYVEMCVETATEMSDWEEIA